VGIERLAACVAQLKEILSFENWLVQFPHYHGKRATAVALYVAADAPLQSATAAPTESFGVERLGLASALDIQSEV